MLRSSLGFTVASFIDKNCKIKGVSINILQFTGTYIVTRSTTGCKYLVILLIQFHMTTRFKAEVLDFQTPWGNITSTCLCRD